MGKLFVPAIWATLDALKSWKILDAPKTRELIAKPGKAGFTSRGGKGSRRNDVHPDVDKPITISGKLGDGAKTYEESQTDYGSFWTATNLPTPLAPSLRPCVRKPITPRPGPVARRPSPPPCPEARPAGDRRSGTEAREMPGPGWTGSWCQAIRRPCRSRSTTRTKR